MLDCSTLNKTSAPRSFTGKNSAAKGSALKGLNGGEATSIIAPSLLICEIVQRDSQGQSKSVSSFILIPSIIIGNDSLLFIVIEEAFIVFLEIKLNLHYLN